MIHRQRRHIGRYTATCQCIGRALDVNMWIYRMCAFGLRLSLNCTDIFRPYWFEDDDGRSSNCEHRVIHWTIEKKIRPGTEVEAWIGHGYRCISRMEQYHIPPMLHSNISIVTFLEDGSSPVVRTILGQHVLQTFPFGLFTLGTPKRQGLS